MKRERENREGGMTEIFVRLTREKEGERDYSLFFSFFFVNKEKEMRWSIMGHCINYR